MTSATTVQQHRVSVRQLAGLERSLNTRMFFSYQEKEMLYQFDKLQSAYEASLDEDEELAPQIWENAYHNVARQFTARKLPVTAHLSTGTSRYGLSLAYFKGQSFQQVDFIGELNDLCEAIQGLEMGAGEDEDCDGTNLRELKLDDLVRP